VQKITPSLWFDTEAEEAASFYVEVFKDGRILNKTHYTEAGPREAGTVMTVEFELNGQHFIGINGGDQFRFDEAVSFQINCTGQDEVDYYWEKLTDGGEEGPCGWLKDRFVAGRARGDGRDVRPPRPDARPARHGGDVHDEEARHRRAQRRCRRSARGLRTGAGAGTRPPHTPKTAAG
jgi:predicted 3-demethylubiquinone-9 3-methyltransferase (glyoxalase superfamily)